ncbi:MAG: AgmX/PglI C-terminal domain-containing protein [Polyangiaceae bacterium]|nr:AgmX/PglI C-terminal domain-containing protein [Polyangiaceae bacterium]
MARRRSTVHACAAALGLVALAVEGCAPVGARPGPTPGPVATERTTAVAGASAPAATAAVAAASVPTAGASAPSAPSAPTAAASVPNATDHAPSAREIAPAIHIALDRPYKLGALPEPKTSEAYRIDILWRRAWNSGGTGVVAGELPPPEGHPDPRVVISVVAARGPLEAALVERVARRNHWIHVVRCHALGSYKDALLHGETRAHFTVTPSGTVTRPTLDGSDLAQPEVAACMVARLERLVLPAARAATRVELSMKVWPGDDPTPPPEDVLEPGPGALDEAAMLAGVEAGLPALEACYRAGLGYAPELWGRLLLRFHVARDGVADEAFEGGSRFPDARVKQCMLRAARSFVFPAPRGGELRFVVPVRFWTDRSAPPPEAAGVGLSARRPAASPGE